MLAFMNVSMRTYFADESGFANSTSFASGKPDQGTTIDQASTQRMR